MTEEQFKKANGIDGDYTIDKEGLCNVIGDVDITNRNFKEIPIAFGYVSGYFDCFFNQLTSLKNAPKQVCETFNCSNNQLTTLEFAPKSVGGDFDCSDNKLTSLDFAPETVCRGFYGKNNATRFTEKEVRAVCYVVFKVHV